MGTPCTILKFFDYYFRSDEENCTLVEFPDYDYYKDMPPNQRVTDGFNVTFPLLEIQTNVTINRIFNIDDENSAFSVIFQVEFEWYDLNLRFNYLNNEMRFNNIGVHEWDKIWKPELSFAILTGTAEQPKLLDEEILIKRSSRAALSNNIETLFNNESYEGSQNSIYFKRIFQGEFVCEFSGVSQYPFGTNVCNFRMYLHGISNKMTLFKLLPLNVEAKKEVGEFIVERYFLLNSPREQINTVAVSFELLRSRTSIILVTYLPTILMNMINQVDINI